MGKKQKAASAVARTGGSFIGGITNNPGIVIIALILGGLFLFRDKISEGFGGLFENFKFPEIPNPFENFTNPFEDFVFPTFTNPFEDFEFPTFELPDFSGFFEGFQEQFTGLQEQQQNFLSQLQLDFNKFFNQPLEQPQKMVEDTGLLPPGTCQCGSTITQDAFGNVNQTCKTCEVTDTQLPSLDPALNIPTLPGGPNAGLLAFLGLTPAQVFALEKQGLDPNQFSQLQEEAVNIFGTGGGPSFIGGTTTFGSNIIDTLSEVLNIFPGLSASQAANVLSEFPGLTGSEFKQINPFVPSISSSGFETQQLLNASGGFSGLTSEQIAFILTGGNIQNF